MSIEDMQKLHDIYLKNCPDVDTSREVNMDDPLEAGDIKKHTIYLLFNALSSSAFIIWMR
jgi:hypothetical protein